MPAPVVVFEHISKKFSRGEHHTSLRDLVPALVRGLTRRRRSADQLHAGEFWALRDVSFEVEPGRALGIIGANGAGKSTTLKILTRILKPTSGRSAIKGRVGALIEVASGFHPDLTGRENIFLQGAIMGMKRSEIAQQFDAIVDFAGLPDQLDTPVKRYSSGMNARLGFSIAAHLNPGVLVIDEVLSVGDMTFQQRCFDRMLEFKRQGVAIVVVSHNLQAISTLCDDALYLDHRPVALGPTMGVIDRYIRNSGAQESARVNSNVKVTACQLLTEDGRSCETVAPGTVLVARLTIEAQQELRDFSFFFRVRRSTDNLLVYDGNVPGSEGGCDVLRPLDPVVVDFVFRANLTRGHYYVEVHLFHDPTQVFLVALTPAASFVVEEMRTHAGIADLQLELRSGAAWAQPVTRAAGSTASGRRP